MAGGRAIALHYDPAIALPLRAAEPADLDLWPMWERLPAALPVLVLRGAETDVLPAETAARMAARPGVRLAEIAGCGHAPALMDAAQVALLRDFLAAP